MSVYGVPIDKYGRKWPELALPNHKVWLCGDCGQPELRGSCSHKKFKAEKVKRLGGRL